MSIQSNFPNLKPSLLLDFANTKQLDNRVTFTRSAPATYYDGKTTAKAEQNLFSYSDGPYDGTNGVWELVGGTMTSGQTAPNGTSTAWLYAESGGGGTHRFYNMGTNYFNVTTGTLISVSAYLKYAGRQYIQFNCDTWRGGARVIFDIQNGTVSDAANAVSSTIESVGNGWYRAKAVVPATTNAGNSFALGSNNSSTGNGETHTGSGANSFYVWGVQFEYRNVVSAYNATTSQPITKYIPQLLTAGNNQPRFDHNPTTGESLGLLIEEQRTNLLYPSNLYGDSLNYEAIYTKTNSSTDVTAPDGSQLTTKIVTGTTGNTWYWLQTPGGTFATSTTYTTSVWLRCATGTTATWFLHAYPYGSGATCDVTDQWQRFSNTFTTDGSGTQPYMGLVSPSLSRTFYAWGWQAEAGSLATSYITTTSASATRTADSASMTGTNFSSWFNAAEGTFYSEGKLTKGGRYYNVYKSGTNHQIEGIQNASNQFNSFVYDGVVQVDTNVSATSGVNHRVSTAYQTNNFAGSADGSINTDSAGVLPIGLNILNINSYLTSGPLGSGTIKKIAYYPIRLSNTNLQALTA